MDGEAEQEGDAEAGIEGNLGEAAPAEGVGVGEGGEGDADAAVEDVVKDDVEGVGDGFGAAELVAGVEDRDAADLDGVGVGIGDAQLLFEAGEQVLVGVVGGDVAGGAAEGEHGGVEGEARALAGDLEAGGDGGQTGGAGAKQGFGANGLVVVLEAGEAFVLGERVVPAGTAFEGEPGEGAGAGGLVEEGDRVGLAHDGVGPFEQAPAAGDALEGGGLAVDLQDDVLGEAVDRVLGGDGGVVAFALPQAVEEDEGEGGGGHDDRQGQPRGRGVVDQPVDPPGAGEQGRAGEEGEHAGVGGEGGAGGPAEAAGQAEQMAEDAGAADGGAERADEGEGEGAAGAAATEERGGDQSAQQQAKGGRRVHAARVGRGGAGEVVAGHELVEAQIGAEGVLEQGEKPDGGGAEADPGRAYPAPEVGEQGDAEQREREGGVGLDRFEIGAELDEGVGFRPPADQNEHARDQGERAKKGSKLSRPGGGREKRMKRGRHGR